MTIGLRLAPQYRVFAGFAVYSFAMGNIFPRLPDIKHGMGIQNGALGLALIGTPLGTLAALTLASPILERFGFRRALLALIPLIAITYALAVYASGPSALLLLLIPVGLMIGGVEIILNVEADRTEALIGRRIINRAHSFWSIGFFGAGLFGAAMAQLGVSLNCTWPSLSPSSPSRSDCSSADTNRRRAASPRALTKLLPSHIRRGPSSSWLV